MDRGRVSVGMDKNHSGLSNAWKWGSMHPRKHDDFYAPPPPSSFESTLLIFYFLFVTGESCNHVSVLGSGILLVRGCSRGGVA